MFNVDKQVPSTELERQQAMESKVDFKIEKNIPVTGRGGRSGAIGHTLKAVQTLSKMEVGDSFVVTRSTCTPNQISGMVKAMDRELKKKNLPYSIKTRITRNANKEFISARIWLIG
jgi:hypothetical protein